MRKLILSLLFSLISIIHPLTSFCIFHELTPEDYYLNHREDFNCDGGRCYAPVRIGARMGGGYREVLPENYEIPRAESMAPRDQGTLGTCTIFAAVNCLETLTGFRASTAEFSVLAGSHKEETCRGDGFFLGNVLKQASSFGFIEEDRLPYPSYERRFRRHKEHTGESCFCHVGRSPVMTYNFTMEKLGSPLRMTGGQEDRTPHRFARFNVLRGSGTLEKGSITASIRRALSRNHPIAVVLPIFNMEDWADETIAAPEGYWGYPEGYHAVMLYGYNEETRLFDIRNSWKGQSHQRVPYSYLSEHALEVVAIAS